MMDSYKDYAHTGPGTLAGRYLRAYWQPIYRARDLMPGRAIPIRVMSEDFTLYRGEGGTPHLTAFRCPHRGTQLSTGWVEADSIRCYYHGWKYDATGQCVEQPAEPDAFAHKVRIATYPTIEYLGLIFAYLGDGKPPAPPSFPEFESAEGILDWASYLRRCNYFQNLENALDNAHVGFVHRVHQDAFDGVKDRPSVSVEETEWGISVDVRRQSGAHRTTYLGMPNIYYMYALPEDDEVGWMKSLFWWVPIDDERHINYIVRWLPLSGDAVDRFREREATRRRRQDRFHGDVADQVVAGCLFRDEVDLKRTHAVNFQDDVSQIAQGVIADRSNERLGRSDTGVVLLRKIWSREMRAFEKGLPLKEWTRPADMQPTRYNNLDAVAK